MSLSIDQWINEAVASGLVPAAELLAWLESIPHAARPKNGDELARELVAQGKLTRFQAEQIHAGQGKSLTLGNYLILDKLGQGGMGLVLKAMHRRMERVVALKVMSAAGMKSADAVQRFHREVKAAAKLNHPNIVTAYDADEANGTHFLVMEYMEGTDLSALVKRQGPLPVEQAVQCILQAARGLEYAHSRGVIHRDIKPSNLLLSVAGGPLSGEGVAVSNGPRTADNRLHVKILDMGLARIDNADGQAELTTTGAVMGTVDYMAPEQALSAKSADARSDIYSLGITLWYLLTGRVAYGGDSLMAKLLAHRDAAIPSLVEGIRGQGSVVKEEQKTSGFTLNPHLSSIDSVFRRMVAKRPEDRYQSMVDVIDDLEHCLAGIEPVAISSPSRAGTAWDTGSHSASEAETVMLSVSPVRSDLHTEPSATLDGAHARSPDAARRKNKKKFLLFGGIAAVALVCLVIAFSGRGELAKQLGQDDSSRESDAATGSNHVTSQAAENLTELSGASDFALEFDLQRHPSARVVVSMPDLDPNLPWTLEGYIQPADIPDHNHGLPAIFEGDPWQLDLNHWTLRLIEHSGSLKEQPNRSENVIAATLIEKWHGQRVHLASVFDGKQAALFVDGKLIGKSSPKFLPKQHSGRLLLGARFTGRMDEWRISKVARYDSNFTPPRRYEPDADTLALYHFDEGEGNRLLDSSGNSHHGEIAGATWAKSDAALTSESATPDFALQFSKHDHRVELPAINLTLEDTHTIEAFVTPANDLVPERTWAQFTNLHDWLTLQMHAKNLSSFCVRLTQPNGGSQLFTAGTATLLKNRRTHIAGVQTAGNIRFFVDGRLVNVTRIEGTQLPETSHKARIGGGSGSLGFFDGIIDEVRISRTARYDKDFTPETRFKADEKTLALYHCDEGSGVELKDSSGNGHHGKVFGAKWVPMSRTLTSFDGVNEPAATPESEQKSAWTDWLGPRLKRDEIGGNGWVREGDAFTTDRDISGIAILPDTTRDGAIRLTYLLRDSKGIQVNARDRKRDNTDATRELYVAEDNGTLFRLSLSRSDAPYKDLARQAIPASIPKDAPRTLEFRVVGNTLTATLNGTIIASARDSTIPVGNFALVALKGVLIQKVEYQLLDNEPPMAKAPFNEAQARAHQEAWAKYLGVPVEYTNSIGMKFALIPPGEFTMGSTPEEIEATLNQIRTEDTAWRDRAKSEGPQHRVRLTKPIYLGTTEVTQSQYKRVIGKNPSHFSGMGAGRKVVEGLDTSSHPVETVSWYEVLDFCSKLGRLEKLTGSLPHRTDSSGQPSSDAYGLPTEAEWEYACRAGTTTSHWTGNDEASLARGARFGEQVALRTYPVGQLDANPFGLFDTHGNVWEWVRDGWEQGYYARLTDQPVVDPLGVQPPGGMRVQRGGASRLHAMHCRSSNRGSVPPDMRLNGWGFRVALSVDAVQRHLTGPPEKTAIQFDGSGARVEMSSLVMDPSRPMTIEAWVQPSKPVTMGVVAGFADHCVLRMRGRQWWFGVRDANSELRHVVATADVDWDNPSHVAGVYDGTHLRLFVNGIRHGDPVPCSGVIAAKGMASFGAALTGKDPFAGQIIQARFSQVPRYADDFDPPANFTADDGTLALYRFDEGSGDILRDSSGNERHGKLLGAKWVHSSESAPNTTVTTEASKSRATAVEPVTSSPSAKAPFNAQQARAHQEAWAKYLGTQIETVNSIGQKLILIPPGEFLMGSSDEQHREAVEWAQSITLTQGERKSLENAERPQHRVVLSQPLHMGATEVTLGQFKQFVAATGFQTEAERAKVTREELRQTYLNPGYKTEVQDDFPVSMVTWYDAVAFCEWLSRQEQVTYRLPTEAEWEFACRAGTVSQYAFGDNPELLSEYGWYPGSAAGNVSPVGMKPANAFGLFDMHGSMAEWCQDLYSETAYQNAALVDPVNRTRGGPDRIMRGGAVTAGQVQCRSAFRSHEPPNHFYFSKGFRVAREYKSPGAQAETRPPPTKAPFDSQQARAHQDAWAKHLGTQVETNNSIGQKMVLIPPGEFLMGSTDEHVEAMLQEVSSYQLNALATLRMSINSERPQHRVVISRPFWIGATEVTVGQFRKFADTTGYRTEAERLPSPPDKPQRTWQNPGIAITDDSPVGAITWNDATAFCRWLTEQEKVTCRLPTEAEWEYACRAGTTTMFSSGDEPGRLNQIGWSNANSGRKTNPAGLKLPNAFGLFDMHGNALEWCQDYFEEQAYARMPLVDPVWSESGSLRVLRGGAADSGYVYCRSTARKPERDSYNYWMAGFRIVRNVNDAKTGRD